MKRRHESTIDSLPRSQPESAENPPRRIFKKRRTIDNDNLGGLGRRRSLRDINNLSEHLASVSYDENTTLKITQSKPPRGSPISSVKEIAPTSNVSSPELNIPLHRSHSEHQPTSTNSRLSSVSVRGLQTSISGPASSPRLDVSRSSPTPSLPRFVSHGKPVRITQSQITQQIRPSDQHPTFDSDQEDEGSDSDEESEGELEPSTGEVDSNEKQRVESNYSEINKLLGDLFLSRHRNRT